jgi:hypothetical protein
MAGIEDLFTVSKKDIVARQVDSRTRWVMLRGHEHYRGAIIELAGTRKRLFDDGSTVVLDLESRMRTVVPAEAPRLVSGFADDVWTNGDATLRIQPAGGSFVVLRTHGWRASGADTADIGLEVSAGDHTLRPVRHTGDCFVFRTQTRIDAIDSLRVRSTTLPWAEIGAAPSAGSLGLDIKAVEISDRDTADIDIATALQPVSGTIRPRDVWQRVGFQEGGRFTESAELRGLELAVGPEVAHLVVRTSAAHAGRRLRVLLNGIEVRTIGSSEREVTFRIYRPLREVNRITFVSPGGSIAIESIRLAGATDRTQAGPGLAE